MGAERVGERRPRLDLVADVAEHALEERVLHPLEHDVERLEQRESGSQECGELLIEERELGLADPLATLFEDRAQRGPRGCG